MVNTKKNIKISKASSSLPALVGRLKNSFDGPEHNQDVSSVPFLEVGCRGRGILLLTVGMSQVQFRASTARQDRPGGTRNVPGAIGIRPGLAAKHSLSPG